MNEKGFTLVEMLVSLFIFGMLSAAGVALLSFSVRSQEFAGERLERHAEMRRAAALLTADLAQVAARTSRDQAGLSRTAFNADDGQAGTLHFVRRGWKNFDGARRSSLQKVEYSLVDGSLARRVHPHVDGAPPMEPMTVVEGVNSLAIRYRDEKGEWRDVWDPVVPTQMPLAIELVLDTQHSGLVRELFLVGSAG